MSYSLLLVYWHISTQIYLLQFTVLEIPKVEVILM